MIKEQQAHLPLANKGHAEVLLSGFGGQGVVLAGNILGRAAAVNEGRNAVMAQSYGPESRGGSCMTEVIIADGEIDYPRLVSPDVVVVLSQDAYQKYGRSRPATSTLIVEEDLVELDQEAEKGKRVLRVPGNKLADQLGRRIVFNMVVLGFVCGATGVVSPEALRNAIAASVPKGTEELNLRAFEAGYTHAQGLLSQEKGAV